MKPARRSAAWAGALALCALSLARPGAAPALSVSDARATASIPGSPLSVIYLTVHNAGPHADRLIGASTPAASMVHLHAAQLQNGVSSMRPVTGFEVPAGGTLQLRTGGDHLMLMGLPRPLQAGTSFPLTLKFAQAGELTVDVKVVAAAGN